MENKYNIDINAVLVKPVFIGLLINIFFPVGVVAVAYFTGQHDLQSNATIPTGSKAILFWALAAVSIVDGGVAILLRHRLFYKSMISSEPTFAEDLSRGIFNGSIICYAITAAITIYGLIFYLYGGTLQQLVFFIVISFISFQVIRPRHGFIKKVIAAQEKHVEQGRFKPRTM